MNVEKVGSTISTMVTDAPLPQMIERLGISIAEAQASLDRNSVAIAEQMANTEVMVNEKSYNLLSLGFMPTFYAFTEVTFEAKLSFSMTKSTEFSVGASVKVDYKVVSASVNASYSQKFGMSAEGSSSVAARLVSLPPPEAFRDLLIREYQQVTKQPEPTT